MLEEFLDVPLERSRIWAKTPSVNCIAPFDVSFEIIELSQFSFSQCPDVVLDASEMGLRDTVVSIGNSDGVVPKIIERSG